VVGLVAQREIAITVRLGARLRELRLGRIGRRLGAFDRVHERLGLRIFLAGLFTHFSGSRSRLHHHSAGRRR